MEQFPAKGSEVVVTQLNDTIPLGLLAVKSPSENLIMPKRQTCIVTVPLNRQSPILNRKSLNQPLQHVRQAFEAPMQ